MRHTSRPGVWLLFLAFGMAIWNTVMGCQTQKHTVFLIEVETPQIRRIELRSKSLRLRSESLRPVEININTATKAELMTLPTIGAVKAQRIIDGRPYQHVADLSLLEGFGEKTMASLRDKVTVH